MNIFTIQERHFTSIESIFIWNTSIPDRVIFETASTHCIVKISILIHIFSNVFTTVDLQTPGMDPRPSLIDLNQQVLTISINPGVQSRPWIMQGDSPLRYISCTISLGVIYLSWWWGIVVFDGIISVGNIIFLLLLLLLLSVSLLLFFRYFLSFVVFLTFIGIVHVLIVCLLSMMFCYCCRYNYHHCCCGCCYYHQCGYCSILS